MKKQGTTDILYSSLLDVDWKKYRQFEVREALWAHILDNQPDIKDEINAIRRMLPEHTRDKVIEAWGHPLPEVFNSGYTDDLILAKLLQNAAAIKAVKEVMIENAKEWDRQNNRWVPIKNAAIYLDKFERSVDAAIAKYKGPDWSNSKPDAQHISSPITEINPRGV